MKKINYTIYQLDINKHREYAFAGWNRVKNDFSMDRYTEVFSGSIPDSKNVLDELFIQFNDEYLPADYTGRSMSVSDVIRIPSGLYYCDSFGWQKIKEDGN